MKVAGFDIGGANTDLSVIDFEGDEIKNIEVDFAYLPMWSNNDDLSRVLVELIENICPIDEIDAVGISMTAELVDAYDTKKDGVLDVVRKCEDTFDCPIAYVGIDGMLSKEEIEKAPLKAAAANWIATAQIATLISDNCIFIDTGSTTTDIIPIKDGKECAIYACCRIKNGFYSCGECEKLPCDLILGTRDPNMSDEEFEKNVQERVERLKNR